MLMTGNFQPFLEGYFCFLMHFKIIILPYIKFSNFNLTKSILLFVYLEFCRKQGPKHWSKFFSVFLDLFFLSWRNVSCIWLLYLYLNSQLLQDLHVHIHISICKIYIEHVLCISVQYGIQTYRKNKKHFIFQEYMSPEHEFNKDTLLGQTFLSVEQSWGKLGNWKFPSKKSCGSSLLEQGRVKEAQD